jgi:murein DD-endopeptidase MepM/ murein hydrolase activator NlpD
MQHFGVEPVRDGGMSGAVEGFGRNLAVGLRVIADKKKEEDMFRVEEAVNAFTKWNMDYTNDPDTGIFNAPEYKLGNARGLSAKYETDSAEKARELAGSLETPEQKRAFMSVALKQAMPFYKSTQSYESGQITAHRDAETETGIALQFQAVLSNPLDEETMSLSAENIDRMISLNLLGAPEETVRLAAAERVSKMESARIGVIAQDDPIAARKMITESKYLLPADKAALKADNKAAVLGYRARAAANVFYTRFGTDERAAKAAIYSDASMTDDEKDKVWTRYESMAVDEKRFRREEQENLYAEWWDKIQGARSYHEIVGEIQNAGMPAAREKKIMAMAKQAWSGTAEDDLGTYLYVYGEIQSPAGSIKDARQLAPYADRLKPETLKTFGKLIMDGGFKSEKLEGQVNSMVNQVFTVKGNKENIDFYEKGQFTEIYLEQLRLATEAQGAPLGDTQKMNLAKTLLFAVTADEHPSKWLRYETLAAERAGFVWNGQYRDMVRMSPDGTYITDTWTEREKRMSAGSDARLLDAEYWRGLGDTAGNIIEMFSPDGGSVSSAFGAKEAFRKGPHRGVDITGKLGAPITAPPGEWKVVSVITGRSRSENTDDPGNQIVLAPAEDDNGGTSGTSAGDRIYLNHLDSAAVNAGDIVSGGDVIAGMGNTGYTVGNSGVHLDVKVKSGGRWVDPADYFGF